MFSFAQPLNSYEDLRWNRQMAADIVSSGVVMRCSGAKPSRRAMLSGAAFTGALTVMSLVWSASEWATAAMSQEQQSIRLEGLKSQDKCPRRERPGTSDDRTSFPQIATFLRAMSHQI